MPDETGNTQEVPEIEESTPSDQGVQDTPQIEEIGQLPEWTQKLIKELRSENAKHRKAKTAADKAKEDAERLALEEQGKYKELNEKLSAQLAEAQSKAEAAELASLKAQVANKLGLPAVLISRLQGTTAEELEEDAKALLEAMPKPPPPATGTDAGKGINATAPTRGMTEDDVREFAAVYGLNYEVAKEHLMKS